MNYHVSKNIIVCDQGGNQIVAITPIGCTKKKASAYAKLLVYALNTLSNVDQPGGGK